MLTFLVILRHLSVPRNLKWARNIKHGIYSFVAAIFDFTHLLLLFPLSYLFMRIPSYVNTNSVVLIMLHMAS
jgi:hypothetical protein